MNVDYIHSGNVEVPSANGIQVARMCEAFAHAGANVTLWYPRYRGASAMSWRDHYGVDGSFDARAIPTVMTERLFHSPALPVLKLVGYARMLPRARGRDVIYTRCFAAAAMLPRVLRARPIVVFEAHEFPPSRGRARALRGVDAIVSITRAAADEIVDKLEFPRDRMLVAADGVPAAWLAEPIARDDARRALGLVAPRPLVVYTGRFHAGTAELLSAVADRVRDRADVLAVGMGAAEARVVVRAPNLVIHDPVAASMVRLYQAAADVLVMPHAGQLRWSRYTSPLKLFEYMAAQRPIVASHLPVLDEVVTHGETALLVPLGDVDAMARAVLGVVDDAALAARLVANARHDVEHYTWEARAKAILAFAATIAGGP